ncbi:MAG: nickel-dependent lactate racemase [Candidatus Methylomirabilia bacterium]
MADLKLPYDRGRTLSLTVPDRNYLGTAAHPEVSALADPAAEIRRVLAAPLASPPLAELARGKRRIAIAVTDITRYCPDELVVEALLEEFARVAVPSSALTFLVGLGSHRAMTGEEMATKLGRRIVERHRILNHDWRDDRSLVDVGTESGFPIQVNREVVDADLRITTGVIEPHLFAGYSGGAKTMVIGAGGHTTIGATHGYQVLSHSTSRLGFADSVFRRFINAVGERLGVEFVVNLVIDPVKRLLRALAGHPTAVFQEGVAFARTAFEAPVAGLADIVVSVPGPPKNLNLYQATRACYPAILGPRPVVREGGVVIVPAPCPDGVGEESARGWLRDAPDGPSIVEKARTQGIPEGAHMGYRFGRFLTHASQVIITDCLIPDEAIRELRLTPMRSAQEALDYALARFGSEAKVLVIPHGVATIPIMT